MTTELRRGEKFMKIHLKGYLKDITNDEIIKIDTFAIKKDNQIIYYLDKEKYIINIVNPTQLILNRVTNEIETTLYFEDGKTKNADYLLKENNLSLKIAIRTNKILLSNQYIKINYTVIDSNNDYDYYIEMSEQI